MNEDRARKLALAIIMLVKDLITDDKYDKSAESGYYGTYGLEEAFTNEVIKLLSEE